LTLAQECAWAVWRGIVVALPAVWIASALCAVVDGGSQKPASRGRRVVRGLIWAVMLAPLLTPTLLVAYAWRPTALAWVRDPAWVEWLYRGLLLARYAPVAALVLLLAPPPPVSAQAMHAGQLLGRRFQPGLWWRGPARRAIVAGAAVFLLSFTEFEIAWLLDIRTWTAVIFDAQAARVPLDQMLRMALLPLACQAAVVVPVIWLVLCDTRLSGQTAPPRLRGVGSIVTTGLYLPVAFVLGCGYPLWIVAAGAVRGLRPLLRQDLTVGTLQQLGFGVRQGALAAVAAVAIALLLRRTHRGAATVACVPGLFGPLIVGMLTMTLFRWLPLRGVYDTIVPLSLAHMVWLLPIAVLLVALLGPRRAQAMHAAHLLRQAATPELQRCGRRLIGHLWVRPLIWAGFILFCMAYFELTATAMLAPAGATPATVMAYNNMHYGQYDVLSARVLMSLLLALLLFALVAAAAKGMQRSAKFKVQIAK